MLRLLAFNAEAWLAEHLNAYLDDPNEYRAIARNLLHLGGQIDYISSGITLTLDRPDIAREWHAPSTCSSRNSTPPQHISPATGAP